MSLRMLVFLGTIVIIKVKVCGLVNKHKYYSMHCDLNINDMKLQIVNIGK